MSAIPGQRTINLDCLAEQIDCLGDRLMIEGKDAKAIIGGSIIRILLQALEEPFSTFFTAAERGGSGPSDVLDLFGTGRDPGALRYARIRLR